MQFFLGFLCGGFVLLFAYFVSVVLGPVLEKWFKDK